MTYEKRLQLTDLPSLVYHQYHGNMIEVYEFTHRIYISEDNLLPMAPKSDLRGYEYKLKKRHCRTQLRANFSYRVNLWNILPDDVISASSVNMFKLRLDK